MEGRISETEDTGKIFDTSVKENVKSKNPWHKTSRISGTLWNEKTKTIIRIEGGEESKLKDPDNILNKNHSRKIS